MEDLRSQSLTVHLAGNDYLTGLALAQLLNRSGFIEVTGLSTHGTQAVAQVRTEHPDVVLVDALISDRGLAETTSAISRLAGAPKVAILSANRTGDSGSAMGAAFAAGASSYIVRDFTVEDIAAALRIVHRGGVVNAVFPACRHAPRPVAGMDAQVVSRFESMSGRDLLIVGALADGQTNLQISRKMNLSEATIKARLAQVMQLLGVDNRVQIAVAAVRAGVTTG
ncbi:LuxR C-terminal-related transcriptional regulator [Arthrobacter sp. HLT1-21]